MKTIISWIIHKIEKVYKNDDSNYWIYCGIHIPTSIDRVPSIDQVNTYKTFINKRIPK